MIKIIKSLALVMAVGAIATGATWSFFSDEEKSTGNAFTAGEINLRVDSESHYNGMMCEGGVWVEDDNCEELSGDLISNGSFETGTDPGVFVTLNAGSANISDWAVDSESVDYIGTYWQSSPAGGRSIDLNGLAAGSLSQIMSTVSGSTYKVTFDLSGNSENLASGDPLFSPSEKVVRVMATGATFEDFSYDTIAKTNSRSDMKWEKKTYFFVATGISTTLTFTSRISGAFGPALDNVEVHEVSCVTLPTPELLGTTCDGTWDLTDLESGVHKFFNFNDIKPGDYGEDTVSLHVTDNDAWGRMKIDVTKDSDGTCVDPEIEAENGLCVADGINNGELRKNLAFSVWLDEGATRGFQGKNDPGEGDNIKQDNEILLISPGEINAPKEEWLIKDAILASYLANGNAVAPGITTDGHMVPNVTYYFGIAWELPMSVGNEAQTDVFESDIAFEVEQYQNNAVGFDGN